MKLNSSQNKVKIQILEILYALFSTFIIIASFLPFRSQWDMWSTPGYRTLIFGGWMGIIFSFISIICLLFFNIKDGLLAAIYGNVLIGFNLVVVPQDGFGYFLAFGSWIALCVLNYVLYKNQEKKDSKEIKTVFIESEIKIGLQMIKALYIILPIAIILTAYFVPSIGTFGTNVTEATVGSYIFLLFGGWLGYASILISFSSMTPGKIRNAIRMGLFGNIIIGTNLLFMLLDSVDYDSRRYFGLGISLCLLFWLFLCILNGLLFIYYRGDKLREKKFEVLQFQSEEEIKNSLQSSLDKEKGITAFISYAMRDSELFNIKKIAESLTDNDEIDTVLYCEKDTRDNFVKYMNEYVGKCDVMFLFCSPNALKSRFVEDEWMAAHAMEKPIIPVFIKTEHIPPILRARIGLEYDTFDVQKNIDQLYSLTLKKTHKV